MLMTVCTLQLLYQYRNTLHNEVILNIIHSYNFRKYKCNVNSLSLGRQYNVTIANIPGCPSIIPIYSFSHHASINLKGITKYP